MIRYFSRVLPTILRAQLHTDGQLISRIERRVRLSEIDVNRHMNQAVYAEVLELGRTDWVLRSRAWKQWRNQDILPVVAEQRILYRRELAPLQKYTIDTRVIGMDGRLLEFEQYILVGDRVHARAECKLIFIGPDGVLTAEAVEPHVAALIQTPLVVENWRASS